MSRRMFDESEIIRMIDEYAPEVENIVSVVKLENESTLRDVYNILVEMNEEDKHFVFDVSEASPTNKPFYIACFNITEVGSSSYNVTFQDLINGKTSTAQIGNRDLSLRAYFNTLLDRNEFPQSGIKIGSTTINETQLKELLDLIA